MGVSWSGGSQTRERPEYTIDSSRLKTLGIKIFNKTPRRKNKKRTKINANNKTPPSKSPRYYLP